MPTAGVPDRTPPAKVTPPGRVPFSVRAGAGEPVATGVNVPFWPTVKMLVAGLVMVGAVPVTVTLNVPVPYVPLEVESTRQVTVVVPTGNTEPELTVPLASLHEPGCSPVSLCGVGQVTGAPDGLVAATAAGEDGTSVVWVKIVPVRVAPVKSVSEDPEPN